uniref:Envelope glycoprotein N n=1 Tax=Steinernema glaseri TaxID=37863 RepID=A0A1I8A372_9BILA
MRSAVLCAVVLLAALSSVYGDAAVSECNPNLKGLNKDRCRFNVYYFSSTDYPAVFAIFAGLVIILALAVVFIVAGMVSINPGKDSIIYRMTTTRMKKD